MLGLSGTFHTKAMICLHSRNVETLPSCVSSYCVLSLRLNMGFLLRKGSVLKSVNMLSVVYAKNLLRETGSRAASCDMHGVRILAYALDKANPEMEWAVGTSQSATPPKFLCQKRVALKDNFFSASFGMLIGTCILNWGILLGVSEQEIELARLRHGCQG